MTKITDKKNKDPENIDELVSDVQSLKSEYPDYENDADTHYKSRNPRASDDNLRFI